MLWEAALCTVQVVTTFVAPVPNWHSKVPVDVVRLSPRSISNRERIPLWVGNESSIVSVEATALFGLKEISKMLAVLASLWKGVTVKAEVL